MIMQKYLAISLLCIMSVKPVLALDFFGPQNLFGDVSTTKDKSVLIVNYPGKRVYFDCSKRLPKLALAAIKKKVQSGNNTLTSLYYEASLPPKCQPNTSFYNAGMPSNLESEGLGVVHLPERLIPPTATSNVRGTAYIKDVLSEKTTNFFPARREFSKGPWFKFGRYLRCLRSQTDFQLINGLHYTEEANKEFVSSYGFVIPDIVYSIIVFPNGTSQTFMFSNMPTIKGAMNSNLSRYATSIAKIEDLLGHRLPIPNNYNRQEITKKLFEDDMVVGCAI